MRKFIIAAGAVLGLGQIAAAQDAMLVLDASGSMWGEIEGRHKILIARDVIGDLLTDLPDDRQLGLVAYGHNRRGDCSDIETVARLGADRETIRDAVNNLRPLGMTPLSAAVQHAAEELAYTENAATVILVSDGEETCDADPCALGAALEAQGVDFTAHVIGFDISTEEERRPLECLARETGGRFILASNSTELSDALRETVEAPPPPAEAGLRLQATDLSGGPVINEGLLWRVGIEDDAGGDVYISESEEGTVTLDDIPPGTYDIWVERPEDGAEGRGEVTVNSGGTRSVTIAIDIPLEATISTVSEAVVGANIAVEWTGPQREGDWITIVEAGSHASLWDSYARIGASSPTQLRMPGAPGEYEVRYVLGAPHRVLASTTITAVEAEISLTPPTDARVGEQLVVEWSGPAARGDVIVVTRPDAPAIPYSTNYAPVARGNPARIPGVSEPGEYEVRYLLSAGNTIAARVAFEVGDADISVSPPSSVTAGAQFEVPWSGPGGRDYIYIARADQGDGYYVLYQLAERGNPATFTAPDAPGQYEARYVLQRGRSVVARQRFEVTPAE